ncbi:MAG: hypothetical protein QNK22_01995 [Xanthomonadales bacterium]|nr:hypothetical protein [Xanthomonadales bacterium]
MIINKALSTTSAMRVYPATAVGRRDAIAPASRAGIQRTRDEDREDR